MAEALGYVLYAGPSMLDEAPIVCIATMHSENRKTGDMVQTWILRADVAPLDALKDGSDASICGDCKHRQSTGGACYVNIGRAPTAVWNAYKAGKYENSASDLSSPLWRAVRHRMVRFGAYGDPAAVPYGVWHSLSIAGLGHTGYTHQWRKVPLLKALCMASADSEEEAREAQALGWRTFRVCTEQDAKLFIEAACPATEESKASRKVTCADCGYCDGKIPGGKVGSIAIVVHGLLRHRFAVPQAA